MPCLERWSPVSYEVIQVVLNPEETLAWIINLLVVAKITYVSYIKYVPLGCVLFSIFEVFLLGTQKGFKASP